MTYLYKEYEVKIKMVHKLQQKIKFSLGYNMNIDVYWEDEALVRE